MTQHIWNITGLKVKPVVNGFSNVVVEIKWQCQTIDDKNGIIKNGYVQIKHNPEKTFIDYENLTEEQIWSWIDQSINRQEIEAKHDAELSVKKPITLVSMPLPWSK